MVRTIETRRGIKLRVREAGAGAPLLFLHGAGGLLPEEPLLTKLAERFQVFAPTWPGFGAEPGEDLLEDMLDFTLHGLDVVEALGLERPYLVGHSMGGMIAAEMACVANASFGKLALLAPVGLWLDAHPIPDLFATTPWELPPLLFADPAAGQKLPPARLGTTPAPVSWWTTARLAAPARSCSRSPTAASASASIACVPRRSWCGAGRIASFRPSTPSAGNSSCPAHASPGSKTPATCSPSSSPPPSRTP
jgi:pimeloyl-ACP methyl ester carboxylesterase